MESMSLLCALLDTEPKDPTKSLSAMIATGGAAAFRAKVNSFKGKPEAERKPVLDGLYKALYYIIEDHDLPNNESLNKAIGKVLARAIREHVANPDPADEEIGRLYNMLKLVVIEAIDK